jgi:hypothetical protein
MQVVTGLRTRDRLQGHRHASGISGDSPNSRYGLFNSGIVGALADNSSVYNVNTGFITSDPITDAVNGTPRTGQFTRPRGLGVIFYEYVGRVNL